LPSNERKKGVELRLRLGPACGGSEPSGHHVGRARTRDYLSAAAHPGRLKRFAPGFTR
jgi:hypothetical protein